MRNRMVEVSQQMDIAADQIINKLDDMVAEYNKVEVVSNYSFQDMKDRVAELEEQMRPIRKNISDLENKKSELSKAKRTELQRDYGYTGLKAALSKEYKEYAAKELKPLEKKAASLREQIAPLQKEVEDLKKSIADGTLEKAKKEYDREVEESGLSQDEYVREELVKDLGTTEDLSICGYILNDGRMVKMGSGDQRSEDHAIVTGYYGPEYYNKQREAMFRFVAEQNIRWMPELPGATVNIENGITEEQKDMLPAVIEWAKQHNQENQLYLEMVDNDGNTLDTKFYDLDILEPEMVLNEIDKLQREAQTNRVKEKDCQTIYFVCYEAEKMGIAKMSEDLLMDIAERVVNTNIRKDAVSKEIIRAVRGNEDLVIVDCEKYKDYLLSNMDEIEAGFAEKENINKEFSDLVGDYAAECADKVDLTEEERERYSEIAKENGQEDYDRDEVIMATKVQEEINKSALKIGCVMVAAALVEVEKEVSLAVIHNMSQKFISDEITLDEKTLKREYSKNRKESYKEKEQDGLER